MQKPQESLDDYLRKIEPEMTEPPTWVSIYPTGEVETVKPLARWERPAVVPVQASAVNHAPHRLSWFHRSLIFGAGVAVIAVVFLSAIFTAINEPSEQAVAETIDDRGNISDSAFDDSLVPVETQNSEDIFSSAGSPLLFGELRAVRSTARPRRNRLHRAIAYRQRPRAKIRGPVVSDFVPTTMIIFAENGEIKTRIEPNLTAAYKRPPSMAN